MYYHEETAHTYASVRSGGRYIDWNAQPSAFKHYPHFLPRFSLSLDDAPSVAIHAAGITLKKQYGAQSHFLRAVPSAGALYPCELYMQIRGVTGFDDGIYHFEVFSGKLVRIGLLGGCGFEAYTNDARQIRGIVALVSAVAFRSAWKYGKRSFRYDLLDSGHMLGSLEAAAFGLGLSFEPQLCFDKIALCDSLGFVMGEMAMALAIMGSREEKKVRRWSEPFMQVAPTDYFEPLQEIESVYKQTLLSPCRDDNFGRVDFDFEPKKMLDALSTRRSIREFTGGTVTKKEWERLMESILQPLCSRHSEELTLYSISHAVEGLQSGIYKNKELLREGVFRRECAYLCLEQAIGGAGAATFFLTAKPQSYQASLMCAGWIGNRIYTACEYMGIGSSGIGAYYDGEVQGFLKTEEKILYALAVGR